MFEAEECLGAGRPIEIDGEALAGLPDGVRANDASLRPSRFFTRPGQKRRLDVVINAQRRTPDASGRSEAAKLRIAGINSFVDVEFLR